MAVKVPTALISPPSAEARLPEPAILPKGMNEIKLRGGEGEDMTAICDTAGDEPTDPAVMAGDTRGKENLLESAHTNIHPSLKH